MALEGTHIRFAVELKDTLNVKDIGAYVAGSLYPDTRYKTGIKRTLTHPDDYLHWDLTQIDDFKKGWFTHLLCDYAQAMSFREKFPQMFVVGEKGLGNPTWIRVTALKLLQDLEDVKRFEIGEFLPSENSARAYNGENLELLKFCYREAGEYYSEPSRQTIDNYEEKLVLFGLEKEFAAIIVAKAHEFSRDTEIMADIRSVFDDSIAKAKEVLAGKRPENWYDNLIDK